MIVYLLLDQESKPVFLTGFYSSILPQIKKQFKLEKLSDEDFDRRCRPLANLKNEVNSIEANRIKHSSICFKMDGKFYDLQIHNIDEKEVVPFGGDV